MKIRSLLSIYPATPALLAVFFLATLLLGACSRSTPTPEPVGPAPVGDAGVPAATPAYPGPELGAAPAATVSGSTGMALYPDAKDGEQVPWEQAQAMILNGEAKSISQTHALDVTLMLKDGRSIRTTEPALDHIFKVIEMCGETCRDVQVATE